MNKLYLFVLFIVSINFIHGQISQDSLILSAKNNSLIFTLVEQMPQFPRGANGRIKYLDENIVYPMEAIRRGIQGKIYVTFIVERDGSVSNVRLLRGIGGGCNEEAIRVIENMPKWIPGIQKGKPVRVRFNIPIIFRLGSNKIDNEYNKGIQQMNNGFYDNAIKHFTNSIDKQGSNYKIITLNFSVYPYR